MATNCFIQTLKEEVDNERLPRLDTLNISIIHESLDVANGKYYYFKLPGIKRVDIVCDEGAAFFTDSTFDVSTGLPNYGTTIDPSLEVDNEVRVRVQPGHDISSRNPVKLFISGVSGFTGDVYIGNSNYSGAGHPKINRYIQFDIAEAFQNEAQVNYFRFGPAAGCYVSDGCRCYGDISNLVVNAKTIKFNGCSNGLYGDLKEFINTNYDSITNNLTELDLYASGSAMKLDTSALKDKNKLYIFMPTSSNIINGKSDIKWFGDTRNRMITDSTTPSNALTGSINELIERAALQGRTDYFYFAIKDTFWKNVTFTEDGVTKTLQQMCAEFLEEDPEVDYVKFTWTVNASREVTSISYEVINGSEPTPRYCPLT